ncbi:hypothetical protein ANCDUO_07319 [Ancylostoma duodenale]|uniref:Uncharacterized protein n=1 Tax=Ancylostoma duodenale TaxID=51022 RepID=A0A0C2GTU9_9BILA|nr:hypothetical protein ANCDUO_07319 [Ancylostoma duodenale]
MFYVTCHALAISRWERERQIGSKVLGHWLNQIRKTRRNENRSNGEGVRKRIPLVTTTANSDSPAHNTVITQTANSVIHQKKAVNVADEADNFSYDEEKKHGCLWNVVQRLVYSLCPPDRDWTITSVQILVNILHENGSTHHREQEESRALDVP